jgi:sugar lactone lactonase YvrE
VKSSRDIRFRNVHLYGPGKLNFDNTIFDETHDVSIRTREIASLDISGDAPKPRVAHESPVAAAGATVERLVGGFNNIDSAAVDAAGNVWFIDARWSRIYRWSPEKRELTLVRDNPLDPVGIAFDRAGNVLVVTRALAVYAFPPDAREDELTLLEPEPAKDRPGRTAILPVSRWRDGHDFIGANTNQSPYQYVSVDGTTFIPAVEKPRDTGTNRMYWGTIDLTRAYALAPAPMNRRFYVADEFGQKTWSFSVNPDGSLGDPKVFAEEGEAGNAVDAKGNVYVCAGNIFVYDPTGKQIDLIEVPERPTSLAFGGKDRKTLFIAARSSLYAVRTRSAGQ